MEKGTNPALFRMRETKIMVFALHKGIGKSFLDHTVKYFYIRSLPAEKFHVLNPLIIYIKKITKHYEISMFLAESVND